MTMMTLLPPNSTPLEAALEGAVQRNTELPVSVALMWNAETIPDAFLPWMAWALSVDDWDAGWSETTKRDVIAASIDVHRHKGTLWSVKRALAAAGYGTAEVVEKFGLKLYDGTVPRDGSRSRAPQDHWAEYRIILDRPISIEQAERVRNILASVAPARCHLKLLDYRQALHLHNARVPRDGSFTRGVA